MTNVLVTGGAGYVGSHACQALARAGHVPVVYDSLERGHSELVKWGPLEVGDIRDVQRLRAALERHRPDVVMHFASYIFVHESVAFPELYRDNIVNGTQSLLDAMSQTGVGKLVVSSSCAVYGNPEKTPITEQESRKPINPYGRYKLEMENLLARSEVANGLKWVALRYFNAAGADPNGATGEWHDPEPHLIPRVLDVALGHAEAVIINGTDYPTVDGTCIRDYVHVVDLADAHLKAWNYLDARDGGHAFNLGGERGASVRQIVEAARRITGRDIPVVEGARRPGDPPVLVADAALARRSLGWQAERSSLDEIFTDAWAWHRRLRS